MYIDSFQLTQVVENKYTLAYLCRAYNMCVYVVGNDVKALKVVPFPSLAHLMPGYITRSILVLAIRLLVEW